MSFSGNYFLRYNAYPRFFNDPVDNNADAIIVIPCFDDFHIFKTLNSIQKAVKSEISVEVIIILNSSERTHPDIVENNRKIFDELMSLKESGRYNFNLLVKNLENIPHKTAGVGNARKAGMDEAVRRFGETDRQNGIIISLDADCLVDQDYLVSIINEFRSNNRVDAVTIQFRHNFDKNIYSKEVINACKQYEIYLRYFILSLKLTGFPYCFHTIGSCFAVAASAYTKAGGMSRRQGGEDFYFLHKLAPMTKVGDIKKILVFPSPRISERVPFGTGPSVKNIIESGNHKVYNFNLFFVLRKFYDCFESFFKEDVSLNQVPCEIIKYVGEEKLYAVISECKKNTKDLSGFIKRLYSKFDAFFVIKFLNSFDGNSKYPPRPGIEEAKLLLEYYGVILNSDYIENIYSEILKLDLADFNIL